MIEKIISKLNEEKSLVAHQTMMKPGDGTSFEYGRRVGIYAGIDRALSLIEEILADQEGREHGRIRRVIQR